MESIGMGLALLGAFSTLFLIIGLYKPYWVMWWAIEQNRRHIIVTYGTIAAISWAAYAALCYFFL